MTTNRKKYSKKHDRDACGAGFSLIEVVVVSAIILLFVSAVMYAYSAFLKVSLSNTKSVQASYLAEEGIEAVKFIRDTGWTSKITALTSGATYYLNFNNSLSVWELNTANNYIGGAFERSVVLENVSRDTSHRIAFSGTNDPNTKKVTVAVSWKKGGATSTRALSTYITNIYGD